MVFIFKYLWEKIPKYTPPPIKFDPFGFEEEEYAMNPHIERMFDFINDFDDPLAHRGNALDSAYRVDCELQHPRPVPKVALQTALSHFEQIADSSDTLPELMKGCSLGKSMNGTATYSSVHDVKPLGAEGRPVSRPQGDARPGPLLLEQDKTAKAAAPSKGHCNFSVAACDPKVASVRPSGGLACLSPGFLEHFEGYQRTQPPKPAFILNRRSMNEAAPIPSSISTTPSQSSDTNSNDGHVEESEIAAPLPLMWVKAESEYSLVDGWNGDGLFTAEAGISKLMDDSLHSAALDDYLGDGDSSDSGSSGCFSASPMALLSQPPSPDLLAYSAPTMGFAPGAPANAEAKNYNASLPIQWFSITDEAAMSNFLVG